MKIAPIFSPRALANIMLVRRRSRTMGFSPGDPDHPSTSGKLYRAMRKASHTIEVADVSLLVLS